MYSCLVSPTKLIETQILNKTTMASSKTLSRLFILTHKTPLSQTLCTMTKPSEYQIEKLERIAIEFVSKLERYDYSILMRYKNGPAAVSGLQSGSDSSGPAAAEEMEATEKAIKELNIKTMTWKDDPFKREDIITILNPNAIDTKVLLDFNHIKKDLKVDDEEIKKVESDRAYYINMTGDMKQMCKELGTDNGKNLSSHGGGGEKAQNERAAALASSLAARSRIKDDSESKKSGESKVQAGYSVVDAASASVHGRSALL